MSFGYELRSQGGPQQARILAVLGPTNTGKTHFAIDRMLAHKSGMIGLPLRLLAREIYDRVVAVKGAEEAALITGEEKIIPRAPRYWICTVESMPLDVGADFVAVDEIQLCADPERGHVFTDRLLRARGESETIFLGSETMRPLIQRLVPRAEFISRPRFSDLAYTGERKLTRLPRRSAVVAFSANEVYAIAELIRRQRGGAAVVMGALSPRTRNAQVALYQSGDVDFLVATDAIGMGINMDVDHVAFASIEKFDGEATRPLRPHELAQIAGRAGRYLNDGTFGVTAEAQDIDPTAIEQIESHRFEPLRVAQWRNSSLDLSSLDSLLKSLDALPAQKGLQRAKPGMDLLALRLMADTFELRQIATNRESVRKLWEVCQVPDFRKATPDEHVRLLARIYAHLMSETGVLPEDWISTQVARLDDSDGDIEAIAQRISSIRTWTYAANRNGWLADPGHWQERTRAIEDKLSDVLHEKLTLRFVDRRTSVLMKRLRGDEEFTATVGEEGEVLVDGEYVGRLNGLVFAADPRAIGVHGRAIRTAALRGLQGEIASRAFRIANAEDAAITLSEHGKLWWEGAVIGRLEAGPDALRPRATLVADDQLTPTAWARAEARVKDWAKSHVRKVLAPLFAMQDALDGVPHAEGAPPVEGEFDAGARGMAFRLLETLGAVPRDLVRHEAQQLSPTARAALKKHGVRFGRFTIFVPALAKSEPARLKALLKAVLAGMHEVPPLPSPSLTSLVIEDGVPVSLYEAAGFRVFGKRAVRLDMLERLGDVIETKKGPDKLIVPFVIGSDMMSMLGCGPEDVGEVLKGLGFRAEGGKNEAGKDIMLWRPKRRREDEAQKREARGPRPPRRGKPRVQAPVVAAATAPAEGASAEATPPTDQTIAAATVEGATPVAADGTPKPKRRRRRKPRSQRTGQTPAVVAAADANAAAPAAEAPAPSPEVVAAPAEAPRVIYNRPRPPARRPDQKGGPGQKSGPGHKSGPPRGPRPPGGAPQKDFRPRDRDRDRDRKRDDKGGGAPRVWTDAKPREAKLDPNSPFAILAKLKEQPPST